MSDRGSAGENDRDMLAEILDLTKENNSLLRKLHSSNRRSEIARIFAIIIGIVFVLGSYYYVAPYIKSLTAFYKKYSDTKSDILNSPGADQFKDLFNQFKNSGTSPE